MSKTFYRRHLPHLQPLGGTFFVTFLLYGALPRSLLEKLQDEYILIRMQNGKKGDMDVEARKYFKKFDEALEQHKNSVYWLQNRNLAKVVADTFHYWDEKRMELISYCIMPNHVHAVFRLFEVNELEKPQYLNEIMGTIKKYTARQCNLVLNRTGQPFWQPETYDRLVRDTDELYRIISYILDNPVKAGLCENRDAWEWSYVKDEYNEFM